MDFWHVHKSKMLSNVEPTFDYKMLRNFGTVRPIFTKIASKVGQDLKEKSHKSSQRKTKWLRETSRVGGGGGGGEGVDSAPPAWLGLSPVPIFNPLKTSPEYTWAGVYGKCVL